MQLTKNFSLEEFTKKPWNSFSDIQKDMIVTIAGTLQVVRDKFGVPIKIVSGVRDDDDYNRLIKEGYHPSESGDHFYAVPITLTDPAKIKKYGKVYCYSVGAADIVIGKQEEQDAWFRKLTVELRMHEIEAGQLILEYGNNSKWIHISNPYTRYYSYDFINKFMKKGQVLVSLDNGKTYQAAAV